LPSQTKSIAGASYLAAQIRGVNCIVSWYKDGRNAPQVLEVREASNLAKIFERNAIDHEAEADRRFLSGQGALAELERDSAAFYASMAAEIHEVIAEIKRWPSSGPPL